MKKILCTLVLLALAFPMTATASAQGLPVRYSNGMPVSYGTGAPMNYGNGMPIRYSNGMPVRYYYPAQYMAGHVQVRLYPVNGSSVQGIVDLQQFPNYYMGTQITVVAFGLQPGNTYVSLYYSNQVCALEPYSVNSVIGGIYTANMGGIGATIGNVPYNLSYINSVSVRQAGTFALLACANVHTY
jgi:hypothetical protein